MVSSGSVWINQQLMQRPIAESAPARQENNGRSRDEERRQLLGSLFDREFQIASLVAERLANLEIAEQVWITDRTVKAHLDAISTKTSTRSRIGSNLNK